jgi:hypothetical protein
MRRSFRLVVCVLVFVPLSASAAPPVLDYLFPAGARRGTTSELVASGTFGGWPLQAWADDKGIAIKPGKEKGKFSVTIAADAAPGIHWVRLYDREGASALRPFLIGTLPEVLEKEPNDDPKKPQPLAAAGVIVNGQLSKAGDIDTFSLPLRKGQTLVAALEAQHTLRAPMDGVLQVLSADGFVLEQNHDFHDLDPLVAFTAPSDGTYLVRLFAFPAVGTAAVSFAGGAKFVYRLTLTTGAFADYAYPLAVARSVPATVEIVGWNLPAALRRLPVVPRDDEDIITLSPPELANGVQVRLTATPVVPRVPGLQQLTLPVTLSGKITRPDTADVFAFTAKKGEKLSFRIEARSLGFPLDPVLRLRDAAGKLLGSAQAQKLGTDPALNVTAPQDGPYRLEVRDLHEEGGPRHVYLLHAGAEAPSYTLKVAADRFTMTAGKPLDIPVTVERKGGDTSAIELVAEGLPAGVTASSVPGKTSTLRLSGGPFAGPFRIVGKSKGTPARGALAPLADLGRSTPYLWLTSAGP